MNVTFITGNRGKADFMAKFLGMPVVHQKVELDELQSMDLHKIAEHKARQAYEYLKSPVLIEDLGVFIDSLGGLPGPFIKWFEQQIGLEGICRITSGDRRAKVIITYAYFDSRKVVFFDGELEGHISNSPQGNDGFGWNPIFIPEGTSKTLAEMNDEETEQYSIRTTTVYPRIREFLFALDRR